MEDNEAAAVQQESALLQQATADYVQVLTIILIVSSSLRPLEHSGGLTFK